MIAVRRLGAVAAFLAALAVLTCSDVWGNPSKDKELNAYRKGDGKNRPATKLEVADEDTGRNRFADRPVVIYQDKGETYFALQVQPALPDAPARPVDYLVLVDTSASKAMGPLAMATQIAGALAAKAGPEDRIALWTANLKPRDISRGFKAGKDLEEALVELGKEVPLGAVNLKKSLTEALATFEAKASRQRVLLFLGDGKSVGEPLDAESRATLCETMIKKQVTFFSVPLGDRIDAQNLHGLIGGTGGRVVRLTLDEKPETIMERLRKVNESVVAGEMPKYPAWATDVVLRLQKDVAQPVLYAPELKLPAFAKEILPSQLPPLRRDAPVLVVGKIDGAAKDLAFRLSGESAGKAFSADVNHKIPASETEHHFLAGIHGQWKARKDRPALLQADRALAYAHQQNQLAVEDLVAKAEMAVEQNKLDIAAKLYDQGLQLDPHHGAAKDGLALVDKMKTGKKTREEMLKELRMDSAKREVLRLENGKRKIIVLDEADEKLDAPKGDAPPRDPLDDVKARKKIAEQQAAVTVTEAIRQATRLVRSNPDEAYRILEQTLADVKGNTDLEANAIRNLEGRLGTQMQNVRRVGDVVKRDQAEALALRAAADARLDLRRMAELATDRVRERLRVFKNLMDQAREEEAYRQALGIRNDLVNAGLPIPPAVTAAYQVALTGYHLREVQELKRLREEKFLATLLEVDRSAVPFPDEPPVEYPSAATIRKITRGRFDNWKDWSKERIARYSVATFGSDSPGRMFELRNLLNKTVDFAGLDDPKTTLLEALDQLSKVHRITFDINEKAFKHDMLNDVAKQEIANPNPIPPMKTTLGTVLKKILARVGVPSGATYLIRRDVIEITTGTFAAAEKVVRVYPVGDLVTPIPNAFNQQQVGAVGTILGTLGALGLAGGLAGGLNFGAAGALGGGLGALGGGLGALGGGLGALGGGLGALGGGLGALGGGLGALGGGLGALGGGLGALGGGLGALGGGLGALGAVGAGALGGGNLGGVGGGFGQGGQNLGVGGGALGFTGGQLGQLGNLGGQFGLQGGDTSQILITLIRQVVGKPKDWALQYNPITGQPLNPLDDERTDNTQLGGEDNQLGYYPPALALVVKGTSRIHTRESNLVITTAGAAGGGMAKLDGNERGPLADARKPKVAGEGNEKEPRKPLDPKEIWEGALVKGAQDPGLIIATTDYLTMNGKFEHTAEFLKANLRQGLVVRPWVYKSLAIALRESGGSAEEIERAEVSAADVEPLDGNGYLVAARALAEDKNYDRAISFCKQAAELTPGLPQPLADAARYAEISGDAKTLEWAAGKLLGQDWPVRNNEFQEGAAQKVDSLSRRLDAGAAAKFKSTVDAMKRRDLVIKLLWQGEADLDLKVLEPSGSVATSLTRQTVGGGTLIASGPGTQTGETYVASQAFSGEYKIHVEKVWGKPLGGKVQLKIIRHQGTADETEQLVSVKMNSNISEPITVKLDNGRRTETAYVPQAAAHEAMEESAAMTDTDAVLQRLRQLADPEVTDTVPTRGQQGGVVTPGRPAPRAATPVVPRSHAQDRMLFQNKVSSFIQNSVDITAQAVLSADRQHVRLSLNPVFNTAAKAGPVKVNSPIVPGGPSDK